MPKSKPRQATRKADTRHFLPKPRSTEVLTGAPLIRIWYLDQRLRNREQLNTEIASAELKVSPRTITRDLDIMRERLLMPIAWDNARNTYYFSAPCEGLPLLCVDAHEALAFFLAARLAGALRGTPLGQHLESCWRKIAPVLGGAVSTALDSLGDAISSHHQAAIDEYRHFLPLLDAIRCRTRLKMEYQKRPWLPVEERIIHPLHLGEIDNGWLLVVDEPGVGRRNFVPARIRSLTSLKKTFEPPADFDPVEHLRKAMGRHTGDKQYDVRLALDREAAFFATERPWHVSQTFTERPDGRVEMTLRVSHLADVKFRALCWCDRVEVLAPAELRTAVRKALETALARYADD